MNGIQDSLLVTLFVQNATSTVASTASATTLIGTGGPGFPGPGPLVIPANFFQVGKLLKFHARGFYSTTGTPTLTLTLLAGATALLTYGPTATGSGVSNIFWTFDADILCIATGSSATLLANGIANPGTTTGLVSTTAANINTAATISLDFKATWGTSSASNTITTAALHLDSYGP